MTFAILTQYFFLVIKEYYTKYLTSGELESETSKARVYDFLKDVNLNALDIRERFTLVLSDIADTYGFPRECGRELVHLFKTGMNNTEFVGR
jgi:hypothetical protein